MQGLKVYLKSVILIAGGLMLVSLGLLWVNHQPQYYQDLHEQLISTDCQMPCFLGVRPGDDVRVAQGILSAHEWVERVNLVDIQMQLTRIQVSWSDLSPFKEGWGLEMSLRNNKVLQIYLTSPLALGEIQGVLGLSDSFQKAQIWHQRFYYDEGIVLTSRIDCSHPWHQNALITYTQISSEQIKRDPMRWQCHILD
ncbi:hypothetical protein MASR2M15_07330 [Anaerolineales bacterium]